MKTTKFTKALRCFACAFYIFLSMLAKGQLATVAYPENKWLMLAEEQFQQEHYQQAARSARMYLGLTRSDTYVSQAVRTDEAKYLLAVCYLKLNKKGSVDSAINIMAITPEPAYKQRIAYYLAKYFFQHNQLESAIPYYEQAGIANLSNREVIDEKFELAYCYFNNKEFDKAEPLFASIKELQQGRYYTEGNYYYGLLAYNENNYTDALQSFQRIKDEKQYNTIVPYYIAEIYYFMGDRKKALDEALELIKQGNQYYDNELHLLAAQCLFEDKRYGDALPFFESYYEHSDKIRKEELYEMAYCYYRVNEWNNAIEKFKPLSNSRDSLGQTAMYLLGDCYLKTQDKKSARNAFGICADMPYNPGQEEAAMMLYAKLSDEMGYNDDAIHALSSLLEKFQVSPYRDEAKTLLSAIFIKSNDYASAIAHLEDVKVKNETYQKVYQKVTYGYAMQQFLYGNLRTADSFLSLSLLHPAVSDYQAAAFFWKCELSYRLARYREAVIYGEDFTNFKTDERAVIYISPEATMQHAFLNMGYAAMELKDYAAAEKDYAAARAASGTDTLAPQVAALREADALFMQKDYDKALALYDKTIADNKGDADYARFQKSIILGLEGNRQGKIALLETIIQEQPASQYQLNARYEEALTYIEDGKYQSAINTLQFLTANTENTNYAPKAWIKIGFSYEQLSNLSKAIDAYKHVITDYPSAPERLTALDALKNLYLENDQPNAYTQLLKDNNMAAGDSNSLDSAYYIAAENQYSSGNYERVVQAMSQYLSQYPNGIFIIKAHFYRAESNYNLKNYSEALKDYDTVLKTPYSEFSENSAQKAAYIAYQQKDYKAAKDYYRLLRNTAIAPENLALAYNGLMHSSYEQKQYSDASAYADTLLTLPNINANVKSEAMLYKAKALQETGNQDDALNIYRSLDSTANGSAAAEARYHVAEIVFHQNKLKEAEVAANNTIKKSAGNDFWIVKSYLLLADILVKEKDYFNAKATLQSIVRNTKLPDLKQQAIKKLEEVKALEKQQSKLSD